MFGDIPEHRRIVDVQRDAVRSLFLRVDVVPVVAEDGANVFAGSLNPRQLEPNVDVVPQSPI